MVSLQHREFGLSERFATAETLVETGIVRSHQLAGCIVADRPEANDQRFRTGQKKCAPQTVDPLTIPNCAHSRITRREGDTSSPPRLRLDASSAVRMPLSCPVLRLAPERASPERSRGFLVLTFALIERVGFPSRFRIFFPVALRLHLSENPCVAMCRTRGAFACSSACFVACRPVSTVASGKTNLIERASCAVPVRGGKYTVERSAAAVMPRRRDRLAGCKGAFSAAIVASRTGCGSP